METFEYQTFLSLALKWFSIQMVRLCAVLDRPFKYQTENKMAYICLVFKWSGCPVFKWHLNTVPFGMQPLLDHFNTTLVCYSDPHYKCRIWMTTQWGS